MKLFDPERNDGNARRDQHGRRATRVWPADWERSKCTPQRPPPVLQRYCWALGIIIQRLLHPASAERFQ